MYIFFEVRALNLFIRIKKEQILLEHGPDVLGRGLVVQVLRGESEEKQWRMLSEDPQQPSALRAGPPSGNLKVVWGRWGGMETGRRSPGSAASSEAKREHFQADRRRTLYYDDGGNTMITQTEDHRSFRL